MEGFNQNSGAGREYQERCPHCSAILGDSRSSHEEHDPDLGTLDVHMHHCKQCGKDSILDRKIKR